MLQQLLLYQNHKTPYVDCVVSSIMQFTRNNGTTKHKINIMRNPIAMQPSQLSLHCIGGIYNYKTTLQ